MVKRIFSLTILLLAAFIMLAHEVVPHHHHEDTVCFTHQSCNDHQDQDQDQDHAQQSHQPGIPDQCCPLGVKLIFTIHQTSFECPGCLKDEKPFKLNSFYLSAAVIPLLDLFNPPPLHPHPLLSQGCPLSLAYCNGLRAPPVVQG
jgi:hypothetical protein